MLGLHVKHMKDDVSLTYLTYMNIYFKEDDLRVLVTQHVECRCYSDTGPTSEEMEGQCVSVLPNNQTIIRKSVEI